jgi:hypothetical protein
MIPGRKCGGSGIRNEARAGGDGDRSEVQKRKRGDADEFWDDLGVDIEGMSPQGQVAVGAVTGGVVLLSVALVLLFTELWWLIFVFGWIFFPALGIFSRGLSGLLDSSQRPTARERELLEALRDGGELSPAQVAMQTSLTVSEADDMLGRLAGDGHLRVRVRGGESSTRFGR